MIFFKFRFQTNTSKTVETNINMKTIGLRPLLISIIFIFTLFTPQSIQAQLDSILSKKVEISEVRKNNYQIDLGFSRFRSIWDNTSSAAIIVKKKFNYGDLVAVNSVNFYRAFVDIRTQTSFEDNTPSEEIDSNYIEFEVSDYYNIRLGFGMEKQFQKGRFVHYYGADIFGRYYKVNDDFYFSNTPGILFDYDNSVNRRIQTITVGVTPFIGIKYYITKQFSVGLESSYEIGFFSTRYQEVRTAVTLLDWGNGDYQFISRDIISPQRISNGIISTLNGIRYITLSYAF